MTIAFTVILLGCAAGLVVTVAWYGVTGRGAYDATCWCCGTAHVVKGEDLRPIDGPGPLEMRLTLAAFFVGLTAAALGLGLSL